jgi:hypothetical protein
MAEADASALVNEFVDSIVRQNLAIRNGTAREARRYSSRRVPIAKRLLRMGEEGKRQFATLLHHTDREIRATAAVYLCSSMPKEALAVFRELAEGDDLVAMGAQMRIKEWEEHPEHYDPSNWAK